jgi:ATP-dependent Lon protease
MSKDESFLRGGAPVPEGFVPLLALRSGTLFPGATEQFAIGRKRSVALVHAVHVGDVVAVVPQRDPKVLNPGLDGLYEFGVYARVVETSRTADNTYRLGLEGLGRFRVEELDSDSAAFSKVRGCWLEETERDPLEARLLAQALREKLSEVQQGGGALGELPKGELAPSLLSDLVASALELERASAVELLSLADASDRLRKVLELLGHKATTAKLRDQIARDVRQQFGQQQREAILREQLKAIQKQLGEESNSEEEKLRAKLDDAELPEEVREIADRELKRLASARNGPEGHVIRTYLDWLAELPWATRAEVRDDIGRISEHLDADHFGLDEVKKRILEHMAVCKLSGNPRGTILAMVGPPGVGKTSLGQSIADATGRPLVRIALGGVRDESEIRGHRRTYVGALPGRLLHALRKAKVRNPVVLLDEIDKLGSGWGGSPEAALLEVLDPEQNKHFTDHYLETPFDLSEVTFIATANSLETLAAPLRDRLEIVELSGYTEEEKVEIAKRHLIPKRLKESGVPEGELVLADSALSAMISDYTREAGVRQLDREITRVGRRAALAVARRESAGDLTAADSDDGPVRVVVDAGNLADYLGKPRFFNEVAERTSIAGVATGLAWTPFGGDILFIETTQMPGKGRLEITGKLGDVMKESARAALSYVRSRSVALGIDPAVLEESDLHIHVPAGAVPKDGPSAGVTIFTALASLLSGRRVRPDTAMTGECSLRGKVLPVGGIKAKVMAAHRAGLRRVILPEKNRRDLDDVPEAVRDDLEILFATDMSQVLAAALEEIQDDLTTRSGLLGGSEVVDLEHGPSSQQTLS